MRIIRATLKVSDSGEAADVRDGLPEPPLPDGSEVGGGGSLGLLTGTRDRAKGGRDVLKHLRGLQGPLCPQDPA